VRAALKREARALDRRTDPARSRGGGGGGGHKVRFWSVSADEAADDADDEMEEGGAAMRHEGEAGTEDSPLRVGFYLQSARVARPAEPDDPHQQQQQQQKQQQQQQQQQLQQQSGDREEESDGGPARRTIIEV